MTILFDTTKRNVNVREFTIRFLLVRQSKTPWSNARNSRFQCLSFDSCLQHGSLGKVPRLLLVFPYFFVWFVGKSFLALNAIQNWTMPQEGEKLKYRSRIFQRRDRDKKGGKSGAFSSLCFPPAALIKLRREKRSEEKRKSREESKV